MLAVRAFKHISDDKGAKHDAQKHLQKTCRSLVLSPCPYSHNQGNEQKEDGKVRCNERNIGVGGKHVGHVGRHISDDKIAKYGNQKELRKYEDLSRSRHARIPTTKAMSRKNARKGALRNERER